MAWDEERSRYLINDDKDNEKDDSRDERRRRHKDFMPHRMPNRRADYFETFLV